MAAYVFVDHRINNIAALIAAQVPETRVVVLNSQQDGVAQIARVLEGVVEAEAIHIVSHGTDGVLYLGGSVINGGNLAQYRDDLVAIGTSLSDSGDILLYGCDVAATLIGQRFIEQLASLTGANVAASIDATGSAALGGDWVLEAQTGAIESAAFNLPDYAGLLDVINGDNNPNTLQGTINDDLITGLGGNDTIDGAVGFDTSIYSGTAAGFSFALNGNYVLLADANLVDGDEGADSLINVEAVRLGGETIQIHLGGEFPVNTATANNQTQPSITALSGGGYVVAWTSALQDGSGDGVYAQRFDSSGVPQGAEFRVHTTIANSQFDPAITALSNGGFVVAWTSVDDPVSGSVSVYAQRFNSNGAAIGSEFRVNTSIASDQEFPSIAALADGGFLVTWQSDSQAYGIYARRYDAAGDAQGTEFRISTRVGDDHLTHSVTGLANGGFAVTWLNGREYFSQGVRDVYAQRFDAAGMLLGAPTVVYAEDAFDASEPTIAAMSDGGYLVVWRSESFFGPRFAGQIYDMDGLPRGPVFEVASAGSDPIQPAVTPLSDGGFVVVWRSINLHGSLDGVYARIFDAMGSAKGAAFHVNTYNENLQWQPAIAALDNGGFVVTWTSQGQDGSESGIFAQAYDAQGNALAPSAASNGLLLTLTGDASANAFRWNGGGLIAIDGGHGTDVISHATAAAGFQFGLSGGRITLTDIDLSNGDEGQQLLVGVEVAQFVDGAIALDAGGEFLVNTTTDGWQLDTSTAALPDGGFVVTWTGAAGSGNDLTEIYSQRFNATGVPQGTEMRVNHTTANEQQEPAAATLVSGDYVVTWTSLEQDGSLQGIYAQRFNSMGVAQGGEFQVNSFTAGWQWQSVVAALSDGGFVVAWTSEYQDGDGAGIYAKRFNAIGVPEGAEFKVNTTTTNLQYDPAVTALANGGFIVAWTSNDQDGSGYGVFAQRYNASGSPQGAEFRVNATTDNHQSHAAIAGLADGGYLVSWSKTTGPFNSQRYDIFAQRYSESGLAQGAEFQVNTTSSNTQESTIASLVDGGSVVVWVSTLSFPDYREVYGQRFDAAGNAQGQEFKVNTYSRDYQWQPDVTALADGGFVVTWTSEVPSGAPNLYGQRYDADGNPVGVNLRGDGADNVINWSSAAPISLNGGSGHDVLTGGAGNDSLDGGTGTDTASYATAGSSILVNLLAGTAIDAAGVTDTLEGIENVIGSVFNDTLFGNNGPNTFVGGPGNDTIDGGSGSDTADYGNASASVTVSLINGRAIGGAGADTLIAIEHVIGSGFADNLIGDGDANHLSGGDGGDGLFGNDGVDMLNGDAGGDVLIGGPGADILNGGTGSDTAIGEDGNDVINGEEGVDLLYGYADNDLLVGGLDGDFLSGGFGYDTLNGGVGSDALFGEEDDDMLNGDTGDDVLIGGAGNDTLNGGSGGDTLIGEAGSESMNGGDDNDQMFGYGDVDTLNGGNGADFLAGGDGNDQLDGDAGGDVLDGEAGNDNLNGGAEGDNLNGNTGNDTLNGGSGADGMLGWDGDDVLDGGAGNDYMYGDQPSGAGVRGNDRFVFQDGCGNDLILDFQGGAGVGDVIDLRGMGFANFTAVQAASSNLNGGVYVNLDAGNPGVIVGDALFIANLSVSTLVADDFLLV